MPKYRVFLNGQNFLLSVDGERGKYGFYTTRCVEAADASSAASEAVERLRLERSLGELGLNAPDDPPRLAVERVEELETFKGVENLAPGLTFYPEESGPS
jgi:hypothetical protein